MNKKLVAAGILAAACCMAFAFAACEPAQEEQQGAAPVITAEADKTEITAGDELTLTWSATENAQVDVAYTLDGEAADDLTFTSGTPFTIEEAGSYVFTFTAEGAEDVTVTVTVNEAEIVPEHTHTFGAWQVTKVPTMSEAGSVQRTCTADNCDDPATATETLTLPALNTEGTYTTQVKTAPTCEAEGATTYTYKKDDVEISFDVTVSALGHKYTAVTVAYDAAKMSEAWTAEVACDNGCNQKLTLNMEAFDASKWTLDTENGYTAPSHTADGSGNYYTTAEQDDYTINVTVTGVPIPSNADHTYAATYKASEYKAGDAQVGCAFDGCKKTVTVTLPVLPEKQESEGIWIWKEVTASNNGENGNGTFTCTLKSGEESVAITVTGVVIYAPVITAQADKSEIEAGGQVTLTWSASESAQVSVAVTKDGKAVELNVTSGTAVTIAEAGSYVFTFTAEGAKAVTVTITVVKPNLVQDEDGWTLPSTWTQNGSGLVNANQNSGVVNANWLSNYAVTKDAFSGNYSISVTVQGTRTNHEGLVNNNIEIGLIPWYQDAQNYVIVYLQFWANWTYSNMGLTSIEVLYFKDGVQYGPEGTVGFNSHFMDNPLYSGSNCASLNPDDAITIKVDRIYDAQQNMDVYTVMVSGTNSEGEFVSVSFEQAYTTSVGKTGGIGLYSWNDTVTFSSLYVEKIETEDVGETVEPEQPAVLPDEDENEEASTTEQTPVQ